MKKHVTIIGTFCALLLAFGLQLYTRQFGEQAYQFVLANTAGYILLCGGILFTMSHDRLELVRKLEGLYTLVYALFFLILAWGLMTSGQEWMLRMPWNVFQYSLFSLIVIDIVDAVMRIILHRDLDSLYFSMRRSIMTMFRNGGKE